MKFLYAFIFGFYIASSNGQSVYNTHTLSSPQNEYLASHTRDELGNTYLNVFVNGDSTITIYGKDYKLTTGSYIFRFDASDSLTLIYNTYDLGEIQAMAADKHGNIYVASEFQQFYFKYTKLDPFGSILWQIQEFLSFEIFSNQILIDDQGNSYVAGTNFNPAYPFYFILKFSATGSLVWRHAPPPSYTTSTIDAIRFDNSGNIILAGSFSNTITMGSFSLSNPNGENFSSLYMASVSPGGNILWLKGFIGQGNFWMQDIEIDKDGNFYFCGGFFGTTTFGSVTVSTLQQGPVDFILGKLSSDFEVQWIKFKETNMTAANFKSFGSYLANTSNGVLVSGVAYNGFQIDTNSLVSASTNPQAFIASVSANGTALWLKGFGDALYPGTYGDQGTRYYTVFKPLKAGYQLSRISEQCYFISGNFANTLDTNDGPLQTQARNIFTGIFSETPSPPSVDLGPDVSLSFCEDASHTLKLNSTLGSNYFLAVHGTLPDITFLNDSIAQLSNIAYGITKFKWVVKNCATSSSKLITINRITQPDGPEVFDTYKFCASRLNNAIVTITGINIFWYSDSTLSQQIATGNSFIPTQSDTLYATSIINGCESKATQVFITVFNKPAPPVTQPFVVCPDHDYNLTANGQNLSWYSAVSSQLPVHVGSSYKINYTDPGTNEVYVSQTINGCESDKAEIIISVNEIPPPITSSFSGCVGIPIELTANGENLLWYDGGVSAVGSGSTYQKQFLASGIQEVNVSQTVNGCESKKSIVTINVTQFSLDDIFIEDVITPNGDQLNEEFYLKPFPNEECVGNFKSIKIINRWGGSVFYDTNREFRWRGDGSFGVYYYTIDFEKQSFKGIITVLE